MLCYNRLSLPIVTMFLSALFCVATIDSALAQRRATISTTPVRVTAKSAVPVIKLSPGEARDAVSGLATGKRQHKPLAALTNAKKAELLNEQKGGVNLNEPGNIPITTAKMSPRSPYIASKASLGFTGARYVSVISDRAVFRRNNKQAPVGHVTLHFKLKQGERYLVDFNVYGSTQRTYTVTYTGGSQQFNGSGAMHVLFVVEPKQPGSTWLEFTANDDFYFYSAELSKVN